MNTQLTTSDIIKNLRMGVEEINSRFESDDWDNIETRLSEFELDVLKCLQSGIDSTPPILPVIGETLYLTIRDKFNVEPYKLIKTTITEVDKSKKEKKKKEVIKKAELIRQENTIKSINKSVETLINSFSESRMNTDFGLTTNKILEFRGLTFIYMAWFILESKYSKSYMKKSKLPEVYEVICSMQRFYNTSTSYEGPNFANSSIMERVSNSLICDMNIWLNQLKSKYKFDGLTIYNIAPKLLIHSTYDAAIPNRSIKMRPNQRQLMTTVNNHPEGFLLFYNAAIASGKTTLASVGIAAHLLKLKKSGIMKPKIKLIFCCNLSSVRRQVARNCWNAGIKFAIGSYVKSTGSYKLTNHWNTTDDDRLVIIASPDVAYLLLSEDSKKIEEDKANKSREKYQGKYWLFLDEPTVGADIAGSKYLESNTKILCHMPKWTILSSATMPCPEKIPKIISHHRSKFPDIFIETQITKEISIGCDVKTFNNDIVVPHNGCQTKDQLRTCINRINEIPFLGRLYTYRVAEKLWEDMINAKITDITDIAEYFSNVDNLSSDNVRKVCLSMLEVLLSKSDALIKKVCSSKIVAESYELVKSKEGTNNNDNDSNNDSNNDGFEFVDEDTADITTYDFVEFSKLGTSEGAKYLNMNLITSLDPVYTAKQCFKELLSDVEKANIDITRYHNYILSYGKRVEDYKKAREYLAKSLDIKDLESFENQRKQIHFEEEAKKRGCGKDDFPILEFPKEFQINTLAHWKKYGSHYAINASNLRAGIIISELPLSKFEAEDVLMFLLFCGVGVYAPYQIKDAVYLREVLNLAEAGKLAYLISDSSICYGTNYPINRVFITKDFADTHSINTLFQLMGRAGRVGQSWKAEIFIDNTTALKIIDYVQNSNDSSGDLEATNINNAFEKLYSEYCKKEADKKQKQEDEERRIIEEALAVKKQLEEALAVKKQLEETVKLKQQKPTRNYEKHQIREPYRVEHKRDFIRANERAKEQVLINEPAKITSQYIPPWKREKKPEDTINNVPIQENKYVRPTYSNKIKSDKKPIDKQDKNISWRRN